jgi:hypothetical protein
MQKKTSLQRKRSSLVFLIVKLEKYLYNSIAIFHLDLKKTGKWQKSVLFAGLAFFQVICLRFAQDACMKFLVRESQSI